MAYHLKSPVCFKKRLPFGKIPQSMVRIFTVLNDHKAILVLLLIIAAVDIWVSFWILSRLSRWFACCSPGLRSWLVLHTVLLGMGLVMSRSLLGTDGISRCLDSSRRQLPGTARWLSAFRAGWIYGRSYRNRGLFMGSMGGRPVILPEDRPGNLNVAVVGPPGTMKSRAYVRNNILQCVNNGWSMLITDPKGELAADFYSYLENAAYHVRILNLADLTRSHRWNPLQEIRCEQDVQMIAEAIIINTQADYSRSDPFWERAEMNLLKALLFLVAWKPDNHRESMALPAKKRAIEGKETLPETMEGIYRILCSGSLDLIDSYFDSLSVEHPARPAYQLFRIAGQRIQSGVVAGLGTRLQVFQIPAVKHLTAVSSIDTARPGQELCAYFCIIPETDRSYHFLSALFVNLLIGRLARQADDRGGSLAVPVCALLDEFCNIGKIPNFVIRLSTMRSRGLFCSLLVQSLVQLKDMYGENYEIILAQCDSWLILGVNDYTTAEYFSNCIGDCSRDARSYGRRLMQMADMGSVSSRSEARRLITADELRRLPANAAILLSQRQNPLKLKKMDYTRHPLAQSIREGAGRLAWPEIIPETRKGSNLSLYREPEKGKNYAADRRQAQKPVLQRKI